MHNQQVNKQKHELLRVRHWKPTIWPFYFYKIGKLFCIILYILFYFNCCYRNDFYLSALISLIIKDLTRM